MFMGLAAERYDRQYTDRQLIQRMAQYFAPFRKRLIGLALIVLAITLVGLLMPILISTGVGQIGANPTTQAIYTLIGVLLTLNIVNWLSNLVRRRITVRLISDVISRMRHEAFNATIHHDMAFFDEFQSGKIITRITNDTQELSQVTVLISDLISQFTVLIVLVVVLFRISVPLTLVLLAMSPFVIFFGWAFRRVARNVTRSGFRAIGEVNTAIQEAVAGIRVAKNFRQESSIYRDFSAVNERSYQVNLRRGFVLSNVFPTLNMLAGFGSALMVYLGGNAVAAGVIGVGAWYLFILSLDQFWFPMTNIASFWSQIQGALSASERIFALIDAPANVKQIAPANDASRPRSRLSFQETSPDPRLRSREAGTEDRGERGSRDMTLENENASSVMHLASPVIRGEIEFQHVDFRYNEQQQVLNDFSLCIDKGESVAFVGHTGAGKSSLIKLITRFYEFQSGNILIDGHDIRTLDLPEYRRQLGLVSQSPFLFNDTVMNNIRYARPAMSDGEVEAIAKRIGNGDWLDGLRNSLQTEVGERGMHLSMGQRQLVALARVLAQKPPIFILDEATASVDPFTEKQIQEALNLILAESTSILIAHRLSTVKAVDRIIVLDHGRVIEEGNHDALMAKNGHYAMLYDTYFRHQSADFNADVFAKMKA